MFFIRVHPCLSVVNSSICAIGEICGFVPPSISAYSIFMETPIDANSQPALRVLEQTPHVLHALLHYARPDVMDWKPSADRWSIREVLAHLVDVEQAGFCARIEAMLREDNPFLAPYDQLAVIASGKYGNVAGGELLSRFEQQRGDSLKFLLRLPAVSLGRAGKHGELGRITIQDLINEWGFHDLGHIRQIIELYRSKVFYPNMGAFQSYYTVHP